jgi:FAD/FMN-containing dehydrogenase
MKEEIQKFFKGEVFDDEETLKEYSHDASLFEVRPKLVVWPKDSDDLKNLVKYINEKKKDNPGISLTMRSAGSDMTGGPLGESIVADTTKHLNHTGEIKAEGTIIEPGVFYRDFEVKTLEKGLLLPCFPASKNLCALGGMVSNNCAGEKTLRYGKMENFVLETRVIFSDGREYEVKPLSQRELELKMKQGDFEGNLYKKLFKLLEDNREAIEEARPKVSKNSAGYYLWNVWDGETFNLNKLIVGSQGTLGIVTEAKVRLVPVEPVSKLFVIFLPDLSRIAEIVNIALPTEPESIESYDDDTLKLAMRFLPEMIKTLKPKHFLKLLISFIPEALMIIRRGLPKMVVLVEYTGKDEDEVDAKLDTLWEKLKPFKYQMRKTKSEEEAGKYWTIRRESFNLLRKHTKGRRTAPFVDDVVVLPEHMPEFLPKMREILDRYKLVYSIAGHAANGNFHIIPLMDMRDKKNVEVIEKVSEEVYSLVAQYNGSITGEHNDGIIRTPYLGKMYNGKVLELFKQTKEIFDSQDIFNPGKKVPDFTKTEEDRGGTLKYMAKHIAIE